MRKIKFSEYELNNLSKINIIIGRNGSGKSSLLRDLDGQSLEIDDQKFNGEKKYISPERGGEVTYQANIEQNINNDANWMSNDRRKNQVSGFRQQSAALFRQLETNFFRNLEKNKDLRLNLEHTFDKYLDEINSLLSQIKIVRSKNNAFEIINKHTEKKIPAGKISSGESELISLSIECLAFEASNQEVSLLLLDEPDVHLHPDLQSKFMQFLHKIVNRSNIHIILCTHSTPIVGALSGSKEVTVCFLKPNQKSILFKEINLSMKNILPIFGAHPLTQVFNQCPILIVEGADEERIWQQVVRSSNGKINLYPIGCGGKGEIDKYETEANVLLSAIYDAAIGFSLRDGDGVIEELDDIETITRFRLKCYSSENLILSEECLNKCGSNWVDFKVKINNWVKNNSEHQYVEEVKQFINSGFDRKNFDLKNIRNVLVGLLTNKPWEFIVGQTLASLAVNDKSDFTKEGSILNFLGTKIIHSIMK